jgi:hypothetical protein
LSNSSNSRFDLFGIISGWEKPFEERRKPFHGGLTAASLLPTSSKSFPQPFFLFKSRIAGQTGFLFCLFWRVLSNLAKHPTHLFDQLMIFDRIKAQASKLAQPIKQARLDH